MKVNKFELKFDPEEIEYYQTIVTDILTNDKPISNGKYVNIFEDIFIKCNGNKHGVAVGCGTDALELALLSVGVSGKYVIIPSNTMIGTAFAVIKAGGRVLPIDIELDTFAINPESLKEELKFNKNVGAVILVHIGGVISEYVDEIIEICELYKIPLIEDAAQAQYSRRGSYIAGNIGRFGCFSFSSTKLMTTGEGGMITCSNKNDYERLKGLRNFGILGSSEHTSNLISGNYKMTEMQAALGIAEFERVDSRLARRKAITKRYEREINNEYFCLDYEFLEAHGVKSSYYKTIVIYDGNNPIKDVEEYFSDNDVYMTGRVYPIGIHEQPCFEHEFGLMELHNTEYHCRHHLCPPNYPELTDEQVTYVVDLFNKYEELP